jgi:hypothetical protein
LDIGGLNGSGYLANLQIADCRTHLGQLPSSADA